MGMNWVETGQYSTQGDKRYDIVSRSFDDINAKVVERQDRGQGVVREYFDVGGILVNYTTHRLSLVRRKRIAHVSHGRIVQRERTQAEQKRDYVVPRS